MGGGWNILGSFSYTSCAGFIFWCGEFLLHPDCLLSFSLGSFCYTSHTGFFSFNLGSFSYTTRAGFFFYVGSFSYTSRVGFIFIWGVSLTHPVLAFLKYFFLDILFWGVSLTHPMLALFLCGEFLLHLHRLLSFSLGSFCYTSHTGFFSFNLGSFSYISRAGFFFMWAVSLTHPVLASLSREFLSYIPCRLHFYLGSFSYKSGASFSFLFLFFCLFCFYLRIFSYTSPCLLCFSVGSFS